MEVNWVYPDSARYINWSTTSRTSRLGHWERVPETLSAQKPLCWSTQQEWCAMEQKQKLPSRFLGSLLIFGFQFSNSKHMISVAMKRELASSSISLENLHWRPPPIRMRAALLYASSCTAGTGACMSHWSKPPIPATTRHGCLVLSDPAQHPCRTAPCRRRLKTLGDPVTPFPLRESQCRHRHNEEKSSAEILQRRS